MNLRDLTLREKVYRTFILNVKRMRGEGTLKELFDKYPIGGLYFSKGPAEGLIEAVPGDTSTRHDFVKKCKIHLFQEGRVKELTDFGVYVRI